MPKNVIMYSGKKIQLHSTVPNVTACIMKQISHTSVITAASSTRLLRGICFSVRSSRQPNAKGARSSRNAPATITRAQIRQCGSTNIG